MLYHDTYTQKIMSFRLGLIFLKYSIAVPLQLCYMFHKIIIWRRKSWNKCLNQNSSQIVKDALLLPANFLFFQAICYASPWGYSHTLVELTLTFPVTESYLALLLYLRFHSLTNSVGPRSFDTDSSNCPCSSVP